MARSIEELTVRSVEDLMTPEPVTLETTDLVADARETMLATGLHCLPVVGEGGLPVGIVSSWDLVEEFGPDAPVLEAMTTDVVSISPLASVSEAAAAMRESFIHHLVVVDEMGRAIGVVSTFDLLDVFT